MNLDAIVEDHALFRRHLGQSIGEQETVARLIVRQAQAADEGDVRRRQARLCSDTACTVQNLARHALGAQDVDVLMHVGQLLFGAEQLQRALLASVIGDAGLAAQQVQLVAAVFGQAHHPALVQRIAFVGAVAQHGQRPADHGHVQLRPDDQRGMAHQQPFHRLDRDRRRGPGRGIAGGDLTRIGEAGLQRRAAFAINHDDLMACLTEIPGGGDADDARTKHQNPHVTLPSRLFPVPAKLVVRRSMILPVCAMVGG